MSIKAKVAPVPGPQGHDDCPSKPDPRGARFGQKAVDQKEKRASRVFRAVNDVYEFNGWQRLWLSAIWFVGMFCVMYFTYPGSGVTNADIMSLMTSYQPSPDAANSDVRLVGTFRDGLRHALGFVSAYVNKAIADGQPEGSVPIAEYDRLLFARLELDFASNCEPSFRSMGFACYRDGIDPTNGTRLDSARLDELAGPDGRRQIVLMDWNMTRADSLAVLDQLLSQELTFLGAYTYDAVLRLGVLNTVNSYYRFCYTFSISRKDRSTHVEAFNKVMVAIDNVPVRRLPLYSVQEDHIRGFLEVGCLVLLVAAIWGEVVQFNVCRAWVELHVPDEELGDARTARRRTVHLLWLFFAQPWNIVDGVSLLNYSVWWIVYIIVVVKSYHFETKEVLTLADYDEMRPYADLRFLHMVWGIFTATLIGLRILPHFKTHGGLRIYVRTLKQTWDYLKDMMMFFGYVAILVVALLSPLFAVVGANQGFSGGSTTLLNIGLMAFGFYGYQDYFADDSPTFGGYKTIFMLVYWFVIVLLVVISQNVLLALVAAAYDEAREIEGGVERSYFAMCLYRLAWMPYSRWHRWVLRKTKHGLLEELLASVRKPNAWWFQHIFARYALCCLPEAQLLAQLYTDPASELLFLCSPWAWSRASPWDNQQMAPWDDQLGYPMYGWDDVPTNSPGVRPRLLRLPPLFTSKDGSGSRNRMPVMYNEADDVFAMAEDEVDDLLDCVEATWQRMTRNALVARCTSLGWSQRGRQLLREGLLEVYRRHRVDERTSSCVHGHMRHGGQAAQAARLEGSPAETVHVKSIAALGDASSPLDRRGAPFDVVGYGDADYPTAHVSQPLGPSPLEVPAAPSVSASPDHQQRARRLLFFNRRGRIADSLDLLWAEMSELRTQQQEVKALLQALLAQQQRQHQQEQGQLQQQPLARGGSALPGRAGSAGAVADVLDGGTLGGGPGVRMPSAQRQVLL